tara:strand:- start:43 stop:717 length:675 start_codon:yes stop_codon:yes gene_type:complete
MEFFFNPETGRVEQRSMNNNNIGISSMFDQVYSDPFNINRRDSEIIIGADGKAKTIPILPMSSEEIMAGSIVPPDFNAERFQSIFPTSGIMQSSPTQNFEFLSSAYEDDDAEQVEFLGSRPNKFQEGIGKLFELFQRFSPTSNIMRGIESIRNKFDTRRAIRDDIQRDTQGTINQVVSPRIMNIQPTAQDERRGGGSIPTRTTSAPRKSSSSYSAANRAFAASR